MDVVPIDELSFEDVFDVWRRFEHPPIERAIWERIYGHTWSPGRPHGFAVVEGGLVEAVAVCVFSDRPVRGETIPFCNVGAVIRRDRPRAPKAPVFRLFVAMSTSPHVQGTHVTGLGANRIGWSLYKSLKMRELETQVWIVPGAAALRSTTPGADRMTDPVEIAPLIAAPQRRMIEDHRDCDLAYVLVRERERHLLVVGAATRLSPGNARIHHVSGDPGMLAQHAEPILQSIAEQTRSHAVFVEPRMLRGAALPVGNLLDIEGELGDSVGLSIFRPITTSDLPGEEIDNMYSELVLFGH